MTIVHPPSLDRDTNAIEHLDFAPPCDFPDGCGGAAGWIIWRAPKPCGCLARPVIFRCDPHFESRMRNPALQCVTCDAVYPRHDLRAERI